MDQQNIGFSQAAQPGEEGYRAIYEPRLIARSTIGYYEKKLGVDRQESSILLLPTDEIGARWDKAQIYAPDKIQLSNYPVKNAFFKAAPSEFNTAEKIKAMGRILPDYLLQASRLKIYSHKGLNIAQTGGEDERAFAIRLRDAARERRDSEVAKIQSDYEDKMSKLQSKISTLERALSSDQAEIQARKREEYLGAGETILGFFMGRRRTSGITTAARRMRMTQKAQDDAKETQAKIDDIKKDIKELEGELRDAVDKVRSKYDNVPNEVTTIELRPKRGDIKIDLLGIAWTKT